MKTMKKIFALILVLAVMLTMAACGSDNEDETTAATAAAGNAATVSDVDYVLANGKLVVGITEFAPMDYQENGQWVGFDADMAKAFAASLGVQAEFVVINWHMKAIELENKGIDCVWNGMTLTDGVKAAMSTSNPYCNNAQVIVVPSAVAGDYATEESLGGLTIAVESGSAGEAMAIEKGLNYISVTDQASALLEVSAGTCDAAIIDLLMAGAMIGEGTSYANLTYTVSLNSEEYGVGFRKGSDLTAKLNEFFAAAYADGSMMETAKLYGVQESIIPQ